MGFKQHHFVLVHGAGHGAWCWIRVVAVLEKAGHKVTTVDLASAGENTGVAEDITDIELYSRPLENLFRSFPDHEKVILVGHSLGGLSLTRMSELFPHNISVAVYLAAMMPGEGGYISKSSKPGSFPQAETEADGPYVIFHYKVEGGPPTSLEWPLRRLKAQFYNTTSDEDFEYALSRLKKFPLLENLFRKIPVTKENYGSVPRVYVLAKQDKAINPTTARKIIDLNPPDEVVELDADHSSFFSAVEDVSRIFLDSAAKYDS